MNNNLNLILKLLALVAFVLSCFWSYFQFNFEPIIAAVVSLIALISLFIEGKIHKAKNKTPQNQRSGDNSQNYQAGSDLIVNNTNIYTNQSQQNSIDEIDVKFEPFIETRY